MGGREGGRITARPGGIKRCFGRVQLVGLPAGIIGRNLETAMARIRGLTARLVLLLTGAAALVTACNDPVSNRAAAVRRQHIRERLDLFAARQADGERRMGNTIELAARLEREHAQRLRLCRVRLNRWWHEDVDRWRESQPEYRLRIRRGLQGNQAKAEWAAHKMFD